jgi:hypothetical protein
MPNEGYDPWDCLDFDFAVMAWGDAFDSYRQERVPRRVPTLKQGMAMVPKYGSDWDVLTKVYGVGKRDILDPIVAGMTDDDLAALLPEW